ncbi:MAG: signal recognition particle receptor subunit alpha, partial [Firmicutes bacterium]|nr:signal recognition particle receptor subunit alpha [Bacillota bacterium]
MFDTLTQRLQDAFGKLRSKGRLTEADVQTALREIRRALLEADVNLSVARDFTERIRERAIGQDIMQSLTAGQQVVKIVHDELVGL